MKTFIAFFDILGFKEVIYNNDLEEVKKRFRYLLRDTHSSNNEGKYIKSGKSTIVPDSDYMKVNCLHISDSIVFWTNNQSEEDFKELVSVCAKFYRMSFQTLIFPLRGCITFGEVEFNPFTLDRKISGVNFYNYSLFGKGLVDAYLKAESLEYSGCILDMSKIEEVIDEKIISSLIQKRDICLYNVPFKNGSNYELVIRPEYDFSDSFFWEKYKQLKTLFSKPTNTEFDKLPESVKIKFRNTIEFLSCNVLKN